MAGDSAQPAMAVEKNQEKQIDRKEFDPSPVNHPYQLDMGVPGSMPWHFRYDAVLCLF